MREPIQKKCRSVKIQANAIMGICKCNHLTCYKATEKYFELLKILKRFEHKICISVLRMHNFLIISGTLLNENYLFGLISE